MHGAATWASCRRAPHDAVPRRRHNAHRDPMLSELGHAQAARRLADWCRNSGIIGMVCTLGIYTSLHDIWYIISSIYLSIYLSIYPSIHLSTHIHTASIIAGRFFVWWLVLFLHTVVSIWRYLWSFFMGGIQLLAYYCMPLSHMGSWGW